ncbi:MAG TPA: ABC transporter ATP-binding protein [Methanomassiliicoccales archaeon]|jgi:ABC-2 type transport system ATP-binding protein
MIVLKTTPIITDSDESAVLTVDGISKTYGNRFTTRNIQALDQASFRLDRNEICGLVGPNGAGKSTLIKIIMGIERGNGGSVRLASGDGRPDFGYVPERPTFFEDLSAYYNLLYFARLYRITDPEQSAMKGLEAFGLDDRAEDFVGDFSKGMKQRLAIARSILHHPRVLLMDEPFSGLDPTAMIDIRKSLKTLKDQDISILLSSHELYEIDQVCDSIIFIKSGKIIGKEGYQRQGNLLNMQITVENPSQQLLDAVSGRRVLSVSPDGKEILIELERPQIPDIVSSIVYAGGRIVETKIVQRKAEDMYTEIIMEGGR